jgi:putative membrane protein
LNEGFSPTTVALAAFAHHAAAFGIVAALVAELALLRNALTAQIARQVQRADLAYGIAAGVVLAVGFFRVFYFEKGSAYYFHSAPFIAKVSIFALVGLASIYPTVEFLSWGRDLRQGRVPSVSDRKMRVIRAIIHWELAGLVLMILCAALMARGVGFFG